jgi:hypothetical protein
MDVAAEQHDTGPVEHDRVGGGAGIELDLERLDR